MKSPLDTAWPTLPPATAEPTRATLHRYLQILGKIRLATTPLQNHYWNVALHLTARGLTTRPMPLGDGRTFAIDLDLVNHHVIVRTSDGATRALALIPRTVADFYHELLGILAALEIRVPIDDHPVEIAVDAIPFHSDHEHFVYHAEYAERCFGALAGSAVVFEEFQSRFLGKSSPVHLFWGSFDLAATRFSGRRAPERAGADPVTRESYSHELFSAGFWPGDERFPQPAYYAYAAPQPPGFDRSAIRPSDAFFHRDLGEYLLPYEIIARARSPRTLLLEFLQSTYEAAATLGSWDRAALERTPPAPTLAPQPPPV